jgi:predicted site-specific integrase-resolvase
MFTAKDLEELLKIDVKTLYGYVSRGPIPYVEIESNVRSPKQRSFDCVEQRTHLPKSGPKQAPREL